MAITGFPNDGLARFLRDLEGTLKSIEAFRSPVLDSAILDAMRRQQDLIDSIVRPSVVVRSDILSSLEALRAPPLDLSRSAAEIGRPLREALAESVAWREQLTSTVVAMNDLLTIQYAPLFNQAEQVRSAGRLLLERLDHVEDAETADDLEAAGARLLSAWAQWLRAMPRSRTAWIVAWRFAQALVFVLQLIQLAGESARRDEQRHLSTAIGRMEDGLAEVQEALDALSVDSEETSFFQTSRPAPFRASPEAAAARLLTLPTGALIEELGREGQWLLVVYHEPGTAYAVQGWVYNRGLCPVGVGDQDALDRDRLDTRADSLNREGAEVLSAQEEWLRESSEGDGSEEG